MSGFTRVLGTVPDAVVLSAVMRVEDLPVLCAWLAGLTALAVLVFGGRRARKPGGGG